MTQIHFSLARRTCLRWAIGAIASLGAAPKTFACLAEDNKLLLDPGLLWNFTRDAYRNHLETLFTDQLVISNSVEVAIGRASSKSKARTPTVLEDAWQTRLQINATLPQKNIYCSNLSLIYSADADSGPTFEIASFILAPGLVPQIELSVIAPCYQNRIGAFTAVATIRDLARDNLVGQWASLPLLVKGCICGAPSIEFI